MSYTYSWEKTSTLSPLDFIQEQNDIFEEETSEDTEFDFTDVEDVEFDLDEWEEM